MQLEYDAFGCDLHFCMHHLVILGDMNYRVSLTPMAALDLMAAGDWEGLNQFDELQTEMQTRQVLDRFREGRLHFLPSYRRMVGDEGLLSKDMLPGGCVSLEKLKTAYSLEKKGGGGDRTPSYTDRILFHSLLDLRQMLQCTRYQVGDPCCA